MALRDRVQAKDDKLVEKVHVPEWGEDVYVRRIGGAERDQFEEDSLERMKGGQRRVVLRNARARLVVLAACEDPDGKVPAFRPGDEAWLGEKSAAALDRVYEAAARLAGITQADEEELVKNSEPGPSAGSGSS